jgi:hypothetical protein
MSSLRPPSSHPTAFSALCSLHTRRAMSSPRTCRPRPSTPWPRRVRRSTAVQVACTDHTRQIHGGSNPPPSIVPIRPGTPRPRSRDTLYAVRRPSTPGPPPHSAPRPPARTPRSGPCARTPFPSQGPRPTLKLACRRRDASGSPPARTAASKRSDRPDSFSQWARARWRVT